MSNIDLNKYKDFVAVVTSQPSNELNSFVNRLIQLDKNYDSASDTAGPDINIPLLITASMGLGAESGEFTEIAKKCLFQGKPLSADNVTHMKLELGDIFWYWTNACRALKLDPNDVIAANVKKLEARYPGGQFDPYYSENRQPGDL